MGASIHKAAEPRYYDTQARRDYYATGSIGVAEYFGRGAQALGLIGKKVLLRVCEMLFRGFAPDGVTKLTQTANSKNRFPAHDICFSVKKWVSSYWACEEGGTRRRAIERLAMEAAKKGLQYLEDNALYSRRGHGGTVVEKCVGMLAMLWTHSTSRRNDPQLHVHAVVINAAQRESDLSWGTIMGVVRRRDQRHVKAQSALHVHLKEAGRIFDEAVEKGMHELYGLKHTLDGPNLEAAVPESLIKAFSTRRAEILQHLKESGERGAAAAARAAVMTRPRKKHEPQEQLFRRWREVGLANGFDPKSMHREEQVLADRPELREPLRSGVARRIASDRRGSGDDGTAHTRGGEADSHQDCDWNSLRNAARVAELLRRAEGDGSHGGGPRVTKPNLHLATKQAEHAHRTRFTEAEKAALLTITRQTGSVQFLGGSSGERLEPLLKAAALAWRRQGYRVLLTSNSRARAARWEEESGIHSMSNAGLFKGMSTNRGLLRGYVSAMRKSVRPASWSLKQWRQLRPGFRSGTGFVNYVLAASGRWIRLSAKTVVIVDNPTALKPEEKMKLLTQARRTGARLVFMDEARDATSIRHELLRPSVKRDFAQERKNAEEREEEKKRLRRSSRGR